MKKNNEIKLVIFDIGRVLIGFDFGCLVGEIKKNSSYSESYIKKKIFHSGLLEDFHRGFFSVENFFEKLSLELEISDNFDVNKFKELFLSIFFDNKGIVKILNNLRGDVCKMVISDISQFHWDNFISKQLVLRKHFPEDWQRVLSFREGVVKPNSEIYEIALKRAGIKAEEALFIDDKKENVAGFEAIGGFGFWYDCTKHSINRLLGNFKENNLLIK
ncbi:MAG: HAD-IA family hydrolase [Candidatus Moraniibacteriota bacterium]